MSTFFSRTDTATLKEEGRDRNHFVSLIVNNAGNYTAAITRRVKYVETREISYPSFEGKVVAATETFEEAEEIEWFNLAIEFEGETDNRFKDISDRLDEIKKAKEDKKPTVTTTISNYPHYKSLYDFNNSFEKDNNYHQGNLFVDNYDMDFIDLKDSKTSTATEDSALSTKTIKDKLNKKLVDSLIIQLITGNILLNNESKIDINKWLGNMEKLFDRRFKDEADPTSMTLFSYWATPYIEFLVWYAIDDYNVDEDEAAGSISEALIEALKKLPTTNKYIKEYINILHTYDRFK